MASKVSQGLSRCSDVPDADELVYGGSGEAALVVLIPVTGEDLMFVGREDECGGRIADVPDAGSAVAGGGGKDVSVAGAPRDGVDAV